jgi:LuxR family maltose regulon positive regulatory protein
VLEQLERANLFLLPLDDMGQWYRYHALFAEAMQHEARRRLGEDYLRPLYDKASHWYEEHGLPAEAVEVALSARDFARAAALIEGFIGPQNTSNELQTLLRWVAQLPEEALQTHPMLCLAYATALLFTLDRSDPATMALIQKPLEMAERYWQTGPRTVARSGDALGRECNARYRNRGRACRQAFRGSAGGSEGANAL